MTVQQVADYLRISKTSAYKLIERQQIPTIRIRRQVINYACSDQYNHQCRLR
ncbi:helix-turn-helix domain-containing protein [Parascardovia denticolens]|uniref:helix-turn-helix domain-containing protein n=1 Tax=Parascardovia denticolens TaxID=78258 RepID=UPI000C1FA520